MNVDFRTIKALVDLKEQKASIKSKGRIEGINENQANGARKRYMTWYTSRVPNRAPLGGDLSIFEWYTTW